MDIMKLLQDLTDKHADDAEFKKDYEDDTKGAITKHFGEEALEMIKDHVNTGELEKLVTSGKLDMEHLMGSLGKLIK